MPGQVTHRARTSLPPSGAVRDLPTALARSDTYPNAPSGVEVRETHISFGVLGVAVDDDRVELTAEDDARAVDYVVEMSRYNEEDTLAAALDRGELNGCQLDSRKGTNAAPPPQLIDQARASIDAQRGAAGAPPLVRANSRVTNCVRWLMAAPPRRVQDQSGICARAGRCLAVVTVRALEDGAALRYELP